MNIYNIFPVLFFIFLFYSIFSKNVSIISLSIALSIFFLIKWILDYNKCTFSYLECKLRGVKKEKGFINNSLKSILKLNKLEFINIIYIIVIIILIYNFVKKINM